MNRKYNEFIMNYKVGKSQKKKCFLPKSWDICWDKT